GLNLTRACLDASVKYPWPAPAAPRRPDGSLSSKFGVYADDAPVFAWLRDGAPDRVRCLEAQVMDLADDISYSVHDVEDAVVGGRLELDVLGGAEARERVIAEIAAWYGDVVEPGALEEAMERLPRLASWVRGY